MVWTHQPGGRGSEFRRAIVQAAAPSTISCLAALSRMEGCALLLTAALMHAGAQTAEQPPSQGRTATGGGVIQLPQTAPPTTIQAPVPKPAVPLPLPSRPLLASPTLKDIQGRLPTQPLAIYAPVAL